MTADVDSCIPVCPTVVDSATFPVVRSRSFVVTSADSSGGLRFYVLNRASRGDI